MSEKMKFSKELTETKQQLIEAHVAIENLKFKNTKLVLYSIATFMFLVIICWASFYYLNHKHNELFLTNQETIKKSEELRIKSEELRIKSEELIKDYNELQNSLSLVYVSKTDLLNDLMHNYPDVSTKTKITILETIISESEKYNMNPLILYSLIYTESSFRHWLEHEPININKNGKPIKIRAVGLGGVVWEWWSDKLKDAGIAEIRGDLFDPVTNIKASAYVYNQMYHMEMHKSAKNKDESALLRYFGGDYISYVQKIDAKIATFVRPSLYRKN
jgi:hypothetical protein